MTAVSKRAPARRLVAIALALPVLLGGCGLFGKDEVILEGKRLPVRPEQETARLDERPPLRLPPPTTVSAWTHRNGGPTHVAPHAALNPSLTLAWSVDAGEGNNSRSQLTSGPVVGGGRIFVLDAASQVRAFSLDGKLLWKSYVGRENEDGHDGYGGGVVIAGDTLYAATGFGEVLALDAASGEIRWRTRVGGPVRAAPVVARGKVIVVTRDDQGFGLDAVSGAIAWRVQGATGPAGLLGGSSPAADDVVAVLPFSSGEVLAVVGFSGRRIWSAAVTGGRRGLARTGIGDITGEPVIDGETIYVANQSGRLVSIDRRTGNRNWTINDGSVNPVVPVSGSVFMLSDRAELIRLDAATGARIWATQLDEYSDPADRSNAIGYAGPLLAGGRLVVVSTAGRLFSFDPETGAQTGVLDMPAGSYLPPAIAEGRLIVLGTDGRLFAFR
ncbi:MAG: quinoprotein [Alphaproteobacteria bacterium]|nr:MAG: quinoprotein [Alphaproteobacteria bacterium]